MGTDLVKTGRFTRKEHVKSYSEIRKLFREGKKSTVQGAKLFCLPNGLEINRIAIALPRGFGNSVQRNRAKRLCRETYRLYKAKLKTGYDMVFLIYPDADSFKKRCEQFHILCKKAGLTLENP